MTPLDDRASVLEQIERDLQEEFIPWDPELQDPESLDD